MTWRIEGGAYADLEYSLARQHPVSELPRLTCQPAQAQAPQQRGPAPGPLQPEAERSD